MQIKREISIMKLVRHPYVVRLYEACDILFPFLYSTFEISYFWAKRLLI